MIARFVALANCLIEVGKAHLCGGVTLGNDDDARLRMEVSANRCAIRVWNPYA